MIANFFRNLSEHGVEILLISGQATVLYGASTFSEDIDLWINPTLENRNRFLTALRASQARFDKLTPPFEVDYLRRGHGFHFTLPGGSEPGIYLDVMGQPPRVGSFEAAQALANWMDTEWGRLLTLGVKDLVELKKTQRLEDYPIISRLAILWFAQPGNSYSPADFAWAAANIFTLTDLRRFFLEHPLAVGALPALAPAALHDFAQQVSAGSDPPEHVETEVTAWMQASMQRLQQADRAYWRPIITELRQLRAAGRLIQEGTAVRDSPS